jgi:hypothetical protein
VACLRARTAATRQLGQLTLQLSLPACCRTYFNPKATGKDIIRVSRYVIVIFGLLMGVLAIVLFKVRMRTPCCGWLSKQAGGERLIV